MGKQHSAGKGDRPRKVDLKKYRENYEKIFSKTKVSNNNGSKNRKTNDR